MEKDYGEIVELTIRKKGLGIAEVARLNHVNRRTVYNWFSQKNLKPEIIYQLGIAIKHDFSAEFPELFSMEDFKSHQNSPRTDDFNLPAKESADSQRWKDKYIALLENYNKLLFYITTMENGSSENNGNSL